ncbi:hypothetical protein [Pseudomonas subflava]|uniref:hypothetical protein n=1 Tax=Pseudomonas subflava TaxID=2952933 RepID=UPI00207A112B|nr:hypothetical protein [Pseudomonas subflava]
MSRPAPGFGAGHLALGFGKTAQAVRGIIMIGSDDELQAAEDRNAQQATEAEVATKPADEETLADDVLVDIAPAQPEDVARKILRETLKSFPIPGKK